MTKATSARIRFLDLARLIAVFLMIQGHTIYLVLDPQYKDVSHPVYHTWRYVRGFTAPMFLFIAGCIFTYLLFRQQGKQGNPRIRRGIYRVIVLLVIGYWLNSSNFYLDVWTAESDAYLRVLWRVDVLHCIAAGLLLIIGLFALLKSKRSFMVIGLIASAFALLAFDYVLLDAPLSDVLPLPLSQFLTGGEGSLFPVIPWVSYMLLGGILGTVISSRSAEIFNRWNFALVLALVGLSMVGISLIGEVLEEAITGENRFWNHSPCLILFRCGWVVLFCAILVPVGNALGELSWLGRHMSRNALWLYVGHLKVLDWLILLGLPLLSPWPAIGVAVGMIGLMIAWTYILVFLGKRTGIRL